MLRPNRMWWSCSLEGVLALVSGETANALMNALEIIGNVACGYELLFNHRHGTLVSGFFWRVKVKFCCNAEMKSGMGVRSQFGSSHFLFELALCFSCVTSFSGFVLSKCLQPSFEVSHLFSWRVVNMGQTCLSLLCYFFESWFSLGFWP